MGRSAAPTEEAGLIASDWRGRAYQWPRWTICQAGRRRFLASEGEVASQAVGQAFVPAHHGETSGVGRPPSQPTDLATVETAVSAAGEGAERSWRDFPVTSEQPHADHARGDGGTLPFQLLAPHHPSLLTWWAGPHLKPARKQDVGLARYAGTADIPAIRVAAAIRRMAAWVYRLLITQPRRPTYRAERGEGRPPEFLCTPVAKTADLRTVPVSQCVQAGTGMCTGPLLRGRRL